METQYWKEYSPTLDRDMEVKRWGHAGRPFLFIPCQNGRFYDFENFHMTDVFADWIENGRCMVYALDTLDSETWSSGADPGQRAWRHEQWMNFIFNELGPFIQSETNERNHWSGTPGIIAFGCSLGATHASNLFFRRPDMFTGLLALSGIYTASYGFGSFMDEHVYNNSPVDYLGGMPSDHPYIEMYNRNRGIIVCGQGSWEMPDSTFRLREILEQKKIDVWVDIWGYDCTHDWNWWYAQTAYHLPHILN